MATSLYFSPFIPVFSNIGVPIAEAKLYFYYTATTTLAPIYADAAQTIPLTNPVSANLAGKFPNIYLDNSIVYRVVQLDKLGNPVGDAVDPYTPGTATAIVDSTIRTDLAGTPGDTLVSHKNPGTGAVATTVAKKLNETVSVKDFGAKGDFIQDDTAAIQAALNAATNVFIPAGIYRITASLMIPSNTRLYGEGLASVLKKNSETVNRLLINLSGTGNVGITLENFVVDGNRSSTAYVPLKDGIFFTKCSDCIIDKLVVRNCLNDGIIDEYGTNNRISNTIAVNNAKDGIYWSGCDYPVSVNNICKLNLLGGFAIAATWYLNGSGNVAYSNSSFDVSAGRDSRYCDFACTVNNPSNYYAFFTAAEPLGASTLHGVVYPGNDVLWGITDCTFRLTGRGKIHLFLANDNTFVLNMSSSNSQGIVAFGSKRNTFEGQVKNWTTGFAGLQYVNATLADNVPASMSPPISSDNNNHNKLRIYDSTASKVVLADGGSNNVGFGTIGVGSTTDYFYSTGSWTPVIAGDSVAGTNTYSVQTGSYVRIGKLVFVKAYVTLATKDAAMAGNIRVTGLPFTSASGVNTNSALPINDFYLDLGGGYTNLSANISPSTNYAVLVQAGDNVALANIAASNILGTSRIAFTGCYQVD